MHRSPCGALSAEFKNSHGYFSALHSKLFYSCICSINGEWKEEEYCRSYCIQPPAVSTAAFSNTTGNSI